LVLAAQELPLAVLQVKQVAFQPFYLFLLLVEVMPETI
jgi:hypothetical protein